MLGVVPLSSVCKSNWEAQSPRLLKFPAAVRLQTALLGKGG